MNLYIVTLESFFSYFPTLEHSERPPSHHRIFSTTYTWTHKKQQLEMELSRRLTFTAFDWEKDSSAHTNTKKPSRHACRVHYSGTKRENNIALGRNVTIDHAPFGLGQCLVCLGGNTSTNTWTHDTVRRLRKFPPSILSHSLSVTCTLL